MHPDQYWIGVLISNIAAIIMLLACLYKPRTSRILFTVLFLWAAFTNWSTGHQNPEAYLEYADLAVFGFYKDIIEGVFAENTVALVSIIAVCQLLIGISQVLNGKVFRAGCVGGITFLLAIAPLGVGSGFPATIIMAAGLFILLKKHDNSYLWETEQQGKKVSSTNKLPVK